VPPLPPGFSDEPRPDSDHPTVDAPAALLLSRVSMECGHRRAIGDAMAEVCVAVGNMAELNPQDRGLARRLVKAWKAIEATHDALEEHDDDDHG